MGRHPLHPMIVPYPFAFLSGGALFDLTGMLLDNEDLYVVAYYLVGVGILAAVAAAIPGLIEFVTVVPGGEARTQARRHATINLVATAVFAAAWWLRGGPGVTPDPVLIGAEMVALVLLAAGGWLGGSLVYRHRIGVEEGG